MPDNRLASLLLSAALLLPVACGGDDEGGDDDDTPPTPDAGMQSILDPPPPGQGVQFVFSTTIQPGIEGEWCKFVVAPAGEDLQVNRDEVRFTAGSHHFLLYETTYAQIPTTRLDNTPIVTDADGVFDCSDGATNGLSIRKLVGGSQNGDGDSLLAFPPDVAMQVDAGAVLLMNAHYINTTEGPLTPEVRINLWTIPESQVAQQGDILFLYNPFIMVPAGGTSRARWACPVHADITISNVQSHMHRRGVGYEARVAGQATPFYENAAWEGVPVQKFSPGMVVTAGSKLDYFCDYESASGTDIYQGPRTTDEMCMLIGSYYPADPRTSNCLDADGALGGEYIGNGTATCAASWSCVVAGLGDANVVRAITPCLLDADPAVSKEISAALNCLAKNNDLAPCQTEIDACNAK